MDKFREALINSITIAFVSALLGLVMLAVLYFMGWRIEPISIDYWIWRISPPGTPAPEVAVVQVAPSCLVPSIIGLDQNTAREALLGFGLELRLRTIANNPDVAENLIYAQEPTGNSVREPCTGTVDVDISKGPIPLSTLSPLPTSDTRLFWDDFENGIKPEWRFQGENFASVNGSFVVDKGQFTSGVIGDNSWRNYKIRFSQFASWPYYNSRFRIMLRVQDRDNYMTITCQYMFAASGRTWNDCLWGKVIQGVEQPIPSGNFSIPNDSVFEIETQNDVYRAFANNERKITFVDTEFSNGGIMLQFGGDGLSMNSVEVFALP